MTLFHLWNLPGDVLAAPESASGLDRCNLSLSLSDESRSIPVDVTSLALAMAANVAQRPDGEHKLEVQIWRSRPLEECTGTQPGGQAEQD